MNPNFIGWALGTEVLVPYPIGVYRICGHLVSTWSGHPNWPWYALALEPIVVENEEDYEEEERLDELRSRLIGGKVHPSGRISVLNGGSSPLIWKLGSIKYTLVKQIEILSWGTHSFDWAMRIYDEGDSSVGVPGGSITAWGRDGVYEDGWPEICIGAKDRPDDIYEDGSNRLIVRAPDTWGRPHLAKVFSYIVNKIGDPQ